MAPFNLTNQNENRKTYLRSNMEKRLRRRRGLRLQWPRHQGLVTMTSVETPPPPQKETAPENPLTFQGPLFRLGGDLNP
ncbi:hypothetical protein R6Q59_013625 [Mikania micrantha]